MASPRKRASGASKKQAGVKNIKAKPVSSKAAGAVKGGAVRRPEGWGGGGNHNQVIRES